jgi:hypothetical protein
MRSSGFLLFAIFGCADKADTGTRLLRGPAPEAELPEPALRRLTKAQYHNAVSDLFGRGLVMPGSLEPDAEAEGLLSVGASINSVSAYGVELYEDAAFLIADQVFDDPDRVDAMLSCTPSSSGDEDCAATFAEEVGRLAWRRPLTAEEVDLLTAVIVDIGTAESRFETGAMYGLAAMMQSPHFLYRLEHGGGGDGVRRSLTDWELATRLSFLLWNSIPDSELLLAAEAGELGTAAGLEAQARRMLGDERAKAGIRNLFDEIFHLYKLEEISKDPFVYTHASPDLIDSAREETLRLMEWLILEEDADFRDLMTTEETFIDRRLGALYGVAAPVESDFGPVILDRDDGRRGLLGHASFLMLQAHPASTSATLRGIFIRHTLLCQTIPPPPADVDTSIPEADTDSPTLRQRLETHLEDPSCAGCHQLTDLVGLGLENFDGIGRWRETENNATIDPSGNIDNDGFADAWGLGAVVAAHQNFGPCITEHLYQYTTGHGVSDGEDALVEWLAEGFAENGYSFQELMVDVIVSDGFRYTGAIQ